MSNRGMVFEFEIHIGEPVITANPVAVNVLLKEYVERKGNVRAEYTTAPGGYVRIFNEDSQLVAVFVPSGLDPLTLGGPLGCEWDGRPVAVLGAFFDGGL